ncbi:major facilitator superfamily domain-containing protein [Phthorimaea operculella]|nr:major facilitator superfamily domain-containing protein [Phthorimaea operculella]
MDRALSPPSDGADGGTQQGGSGETLETNKPADAVSETDTLRPAPRALPPIPESEPLLQDPIASALGDRKQNGRPPLHVQFDAQSPPAPVSSSSSSSSSDDEDVSIAEARPPDGGWGWVVVFASFMVNLIADGITFSFGVFFPHFLEYFGEGKGKTAWIAGIFMAMPLLSGPIASFLTDRYGCRRMTIVGSILAALGFVISAFVDNMETLFLTFGIMAGFGLSLCYVAAVVIVAYYFEKKRSLATGISVCGSGIGTFVFAPLTYVLLDEYGWRGTTLILAGLFLNMAVCGLLMRDLPFSDSKSSAAGSTKVADNVDIKTVASPIVPQFSSLVDLPTFMTGGEGVSLEVFELMSNKGRAYAMLAQNYPGMMLPSRSFSDSGRLNEVQSPPRALMSPNALSPGTMSPTSVPPANGSVPPSLNEKAALQLWLKRQAATGVVPKKPPAFLKDLRVHRHSLTYRGAMLNINRYRLRASSCPNIFRNSMTTIAREKLQWYAGLWDFWDLVRDVLDFSHFRNPAFVFFSISNFLLYMWYDVPYVYIADHAINLNFSESQASMLISVIGILNMLGENDSCQLRNPAFVFFSISNFLLYMWYDVPYVYIADHAINLNFSESQASMLISVIGILNMLGESRKPALVFFSISNFLLYMWYDVPYVYIADHAINLNFSESQASMLISVIGILNMLGESRNPAFVFFSISNFLLYMWYDVPYVYIADHAINLNFSESQASMLISVIGILNMLGESRNPAFVFFSISNFLLYMWYDVPYVYIADHAINLNFSESQASMLISVIGILNMLGEQLHMWYDVPYVYIADHAINLNFSESQASMLISVIGILNMLGESRNPALVFFSISNFLLYMWYDVPYVYIADHAINLNFSESQASMLISVIGILNMLGEQLHMWYDVPYVYIADHAINLNFSESQASMLISVIGILNMLGENDSCHSRNPAFVFFSISNFLLYMWYDVPYVYIADHAINLNFSESQASMLISVIGILNMLGEIVLGWVGDFESVSASLVYAVCMVLCGLVTLLMPLLTDYFSLASASGLFGMFIAANYSLTSIILVEQITLEKFTNAYGLLLLIQGVANLIGPPLAGWIYDITDSYDLSFYLAGIFIAVSGLILVILPLYRRIVRKDVKKEQNGQIKQNGKLKLIV